jgi:hypothetical protein
MKVMSTDRKSLTLARVTVLPLRVSPPTLGDVGMR